MVSGLSDVAELIGQADELALAGKFEEAQRAYDAAIAGDHTNPLAWIGKASVLKVLGRYDEAGACIDAALAGISAWAAADGQDVERVAAFVSMLWVLKAEALLYAEKPDEVIEALDRAKTGGAEDAAALVVRGQAYALTKEFSKAGDCFYQAEEWCNTHEDSMLTQVWLCKVHLAKTAGGMLAPPYAAEMYAEKRGFKHPEGTPEEILERANNLRSAGLLYDALRYYDAAREAGHPNRALVLFLSGVVFEQLRRGDDALSCYSSALKADPEPEDEFRIRTRWAGLRADKSRQM